MSARAFALILTASLACASLLLALADGHDSGALAIAGLACLGGLGLAWVVWSHQGHYGQLVRLALVLGLVAGLGAVVQLLG